MPAPEPPVKVPSELQKKQEALWREAEKEGKVHLCCRGAVFETFLMQNLWAQTVWKQGLAAWPGASQRWLEQVSWPQRAFNSLGIFKKFPKLYSKARATSWCFSSFFSWSPFSEWPGAGWGREEFSKAKPGSFCLELLGNNCSNTGEPLDGWQRAGAFSPGSAGAECSQWKRKEALLHKWLVWDVQSYLVTF